MDEIHLIKSGLPLSDHCIWVLTVNKVNIGYVDTRVDADLFLTAITKKLMATITVPKLQIIDQYNRKIFAVEKGLLRSKWRWVYSLKINAVQKCNAILDVRRIAEIKDEERLDNWSNESIYPRVKILKGSRGS